jgi:hypothetical protein
MRNALALIAFCAACSLPFASHERAARRDIDRLTAPEMRGRSARTFGAAIAAMWIANEFRALGLSPGGDHGTFFQQFEAAQKDGALAFANVVGVWPGDRAGETVTTIISGMANRARLANRANSTQAPTTTHPASWRCSGSRAN